MKINNGTSGGGDFLKPADHQGAKGILLEPTKILRGQPGKFGVRDILVADITIFNTKETLDGTEDPIYLQGVKITGAILIKDQEDRVGKEATVGKFVGLPNPKGDKPIWAVRQVDQAVYDRIVAYREKREAALEATLNEEVPEWMK